MLSQFVFVLRIANKREAVCPYALREVSVLTELLLGHLRYRVTDVPPQPNSPPDYVFDPDRMEKMGGQERKRTRRKERKKVNELDTVFFAVGRKWGSKKKEEEEKKGKSGQAKKERTTTKQKKETK